MRLTSTFWGVLMAVSQPAWSDQGVSDSLGLPTVRSLGPLIADRRRALGRSQREFADLLCGTSGRPTVTRTEISRYERETRIPTPASLADLALALRLPAVTLQWAAELAQYRRRASLERTTIEMLPGIVIGAAPQPHPMLFLGVGDTPVGPAPVRAPSAGAGSADPGG
jgi:transcriptional regulator with XRE-family HTH domain